MENNYKSYKLKKREKMARGIYKLTLEGRENARPGQFYMLRAWQDYPLLSRPLSLHDCKEEEFSFLYQERGRGSKILTSLKENDEIKVLGPLGHGFEIGNYKKVAMISGAVGLAPFLYLAKELKKREIEVDFYAGFQEESYALEDFKPLVEKIYISSDKGLEGFHGNVVELLKSKKIEDYDQIYSCGPNPMLYSLLKLVDPKKAQVSLEAHMACGFGACLGCNIETRSGEKRVCQHGPVFSGGDIIA